MAKAADILAHIDLSDQHMTLVIDGLEMHHWPVSTARAGKRTPTGIYGVEAMHRMHYSTLYNNAPMPHSIFFAGNYAIHGTDQISRLGQPASAGCVRLHPDNAQLLYELVRARGPQSLTIEIVP
ncbi:L,D-transpeptidase [Roseovarius aestuariivivens]|uniref:L,D-transpeptidase n=1 Tax=Roseovarius aestuariivivens TaxID=1888910 RepID=UPI001FD9D9CA|nr:L,D-transpeptidase [Roseovarius aestuariivivens]